LDEIIGLNTVVEAVLPHCGHGMSNGTPMGILKKD
jgi:hypothetical protein